MATGARESRRQKRNVRLPGKTKLQAQERIKYSICLVIICVCVCDAEDGTRSITDGSAPPRNHSPAPVNTRQAFNATAMACKLLLNAVFLSPACMSTHHMHQAEARRGESDLPLGLEFQSVGSYYMGAKNQIQVLCKRSKCS